MRTSLNPSSLLTTMLSILLLSLVSSQELEGTFKEAESNFYKYESYSGFLLSEQSWDRGVFELDFKALLAKGYAETMGVTNFMVEP